MPGSVRDAGNTMIRTSIAPVLIDFGVSLASKTPDQYSEKTFQPGNFMRLCRSGCWKYIKIKSAKAFPRKKMCTQSGRH